MPPTLFRTPALDRPHLLAVPVRTALTALPWAADVHVVEIDPALSDTAAFCDAYDFSPEQSANCVVVIGRRGERTTFAACVVLATSRADVNGVVRRRLDARKASFAPQEQAVTESGMEFGGITPIGLPASWPVLVDEAVLTAGDVIIGSGIRGSKLLLPGARLVDLPHAEVIEGLGSPTSTS